MIGGDGAVIRYNGGVSGFENLCVVCAYSEPCGTGSHVQKSNF